MTKIAAKVVYSPETEALRILNIAQSIANGFFKINNFLVVPLESNIGSSNNILFPDLNYQQIPRFWKRVLTQVSVDKIPIEAEKELLNQTIELSKSKLPIANIDDVIQKWNNISDEVTTAISQIIPEFENKVSGITIYPTVIGSSCSFDMSSHFPADLKLYLRNDQTLSTIVWAIVTILTRQEIVEDLDGLWSESQILSDWITSKSTLSILLKKYDPHFDQLSIKNLRKIQSTENIIESEMFYKKLGLSLYNGNLLEIKNDKACFQNTPLEQLTMKESSVLRLFINRSNEVIETDEISKYIFENDEDFSLWAIAKFIQRLRDKLETNGISGSIIQTMRGRGYLLRN